MIREAFLLAAVALGAAQDGEFEVLASEARWEELIAATAERLGEAPDDAATLYWSGRAHVERARQLLAGRAGRGPRRGVDLALDLAHSLLDRARDQLTAASVVQGDHRSDALGWLAYARYLGDEDPMLAADMERWYERDRAAYAAYVRGLIARDAGEDSAAEWFGRASEAPDARPDFALVWAETLAARGDRAGALAAWDRARTVGAPRGALAATLQAVLPAASDADDRLRRLDVLLTETGAHADALLAWYRAHALEQVGRTEEAEAAMARASDGRTEATTRAHARLLAVLDRPREALELLVPVVAAGDVAALDQLVEMADGLGGRRRFDEALEAYDAALAAEPNHARALANRALTLARAGRSLEGYDLLVQRHPGRADLVNDAGLASWGWGRLDEARARLEAAAALPGAADARENLAALLLTVAPVDTGRAGELLESVLEQEPARERALFLRHLSAAIRSR